MTDHDSSVNCLPIRVDSNGNVCADPRRRASNARARRVVSSRARTNARAMRRAFTRAVALERGVVAAARASVASSTGRAAVEVEASRGERWRAIAGASDENASASDGFDVARAFAAGGMMADGGLGSRVLDMWLMAVPKRKVTPSRRKKRNQFKRVPFIESVVRCRVCGKVDLPHVRCCERESVERDRGERDAGEP